MNVVRIPAGTREILIRSDGPLPSGAYVVVAEIARLAAKLTAGD